MQRIVFIAEKNKKTWSVRGNGYDFSPIRRFSEAFIEPKFFLKLSQNFYLSENASIIMLENLCG